MADIPDYSVQPRPKLVDGAVSVHDLVMRDLQLLLDPGPVLDAALEGVEGRKNYGLRKYETVLHVNNGRDYLGDVDDEVGDLVAYLRAFMQREPGLVEEFGLDQDYRWALLFMAKVRTMMVKRREGLT